MSVSDQDTASRTFLGFTEVHDNASIQLGVVPAKAGTQ
jgi:hypothetical protein